MNFYFYLEGFIKFFIKESYVLGIKRFEGDLLEYFILIIFMLKYFIMKKLIYFRI